MLRIIGCKFVFMCAIGAIAAVPVLFAQETGNCTALYEKFLIERKGPELVKYKAAMASGKEILERCGTDVDQEKIKEYVNRQIPRLAETIRILELEERFNSAGRQADRDNLISAGKDLIAASHPASLDIMLVIASIGYESSVAQPPIRKYNDDAVKYAKLALDRLQSGSKSENFGLFKYTYRTKACPDGRENATGWMNYTIGYLMADQKRTNDAIPYYYKASQVGCETKNLPNLYRAIAAWYIDAAKTIEDKIKEKIAQAQGIETEETRAMDALVNGYLDRALDAIGRAHKAWLATSKTGAAADTIYTSMRDLYGVRYDGKMDGFDQFVAKIGETPFPDPTSEIKPSPVPR